MLGQHAGVFANGAVYWMGRTGGFYVYDGTVKSLPCLVEDFVFTTNGNNPGINFNSGQLVYAGINELYSEINWFYATANSQVINRVVTYNFAERVWTTGTLDRTTWVGSTVYEQPYATDFNSGDTPTFPVVSGVSNGATIYYEHERGINQSNGDGTETAITSFIKSGEFDLNGRQGVPGDGEFLMSIKRFMPDFKRISGNAKVTIFLNEFPQGSTQASSPLGPFTVSATTTKIDTRARARLAAVQIENENLNESWRYGTFRFDVSGWKKIMARITIVLPEPKEEYSSEDQRQILQALRTLQQQLNFSFETDIKNDVNAFNYFFNVMTIQYKNQGLNLSTTGTTSVLSCPTSATFILKQIQVDNSSSNPVNLSVQVTDTSASTTFSISRKAIAANTVSNIITQTLVLEGGDILKMTAGTANEIQGIISYAQIDRSQENG